MDRLKLDARDRSDMSKGRMKKIRRQGYVTGSVFGHDSEPVPVELKIEDLAKQVKSAAGGINSLFDLTINDAPTKSDGIVMIKEFYKDPVSRKVLDIQFQRINLREKISVGVPVELVGDAPGVAEGGMLDQVLDEIQVHCLPTDIPAKLEVDVSGLNLGDVLRAGDVSLPDGVELTTDPEQVICSVRAPQMAVEEEVAAEAEAAEAAEEAAPKAEGGEE